MFQFNINPYDLIRRGVKIPSASTSMKGALISSVTEVLHRSESIQLMMQFACTVVWDQLSTAEAWCTVSKWERRSLQQLWGWWMWRLEAWNAGFTLLRASIDLRANSWTMGDVCVCNHQIRRYSAVCSG